MTIKAFSLLPLAALCAFSSQAQAELPAIQRIEQLENQVALLSEQQASRFTFNGFASVAMQVSDNDAGFAGATNQAEFNNGSLVGLQGSFSVAEGTDVTVQLVARGEDDWDPEVEWAFISHHFDNGLTVRTGKLRLPLFMLSDYLEVGYAHPWARVPEEVYGSVVVSSFTGLDVLYDIELDESTVSLQAFGGNHTLPTSQSSFGVETKFRDIIGGVVSWTDETVSLRASYTQANVTSDQDWNVEGQVLPMTRFDSDKATFIGLGARYDQGNFFALTELTRTEVEGFYSDVDAAYVTLGYNVSSITPYVSVARSETQDNEERMVFHKGLLDIERTSYTAGLRWDVQSNMAVKADVTYSTDFGDTRGGLLGAADDNTIDDTTVYTVKLDVMF
jgi:opacity protein-like surface antigen